MEPVPTPPFDLGSYPLEPVLAASANGWAQELLGDETWTMDPASGGMFNPSDHSVSSVNPPSTPGLMTVLASGPVRQVACDSYVCIGGPGASTVDIALYPDSLVGGESYLGWTGTSFEPGPAIETNGYYWYRLAVQWDEPFADPMSIFYAKTYRAGGNGQPFKLWAFKHLPDDRLCETKPDEGSLACLFSCAELGPFLRAELTPDDGKGKLRTTYDWLFSALNSSPGEDSPFLWDFIKQADGTLALSPSEPHEGMKLYTSVRPDYNDCAQLQAPGSEDWITAVGADEKLTTEAIGILGCAFRGLNGRYLALDEAANEVEGHTGYRVRAALPELTEDCTFRISNASVLQEDLGFLMGYKPTADDVQAVIDAYNIPGLTEDDIRKLVEKAPEFTPELLAEAHEHRLRHPEAVAVGGGWILAGVIAMAIIGGVIGGLMAGPNGAVAGALAGAWAGGQIGLALTVHPPHEDPTNTVNPGNPNIARTLVHIQPTGGPYENNHLWEDLLRLTKFPQIGDAGLPDAGCVSPPGAGNALQIWFPTRQQVAPSIVDPEKYPQSHARDGTALTMSLFVVVQLKGADSFQMRTHPDMSGLNRAQRPNHSQLTQGSRIWALMGYDVMHVYAAGELYVTDQGVIRGLVPKTGHYVDWTQSFDANVFATTLATLKALGYSTGGILTGDDFYRWFSGFPMTGTRLSRPVAV
ncbi:MAG TPA: hypothetical protein VKB23_04325 [Solirubrobacterales bacterium]|nr:hypothetical protein [Solirubrobacterales bacterium]